ncbi:MAG: bacillithiol biosynthesis BshC [Gemmatimonadaceae bacterium]
MSEQARPQIITEALGGSMLARAALERRAPAGWFEAPPDNMAEWWGRATRIGAAGAAGRAIDALGGAIRANGAAAENLARVRRENGVFVTTGQQPGLFGGPVYTWSKALSAAALAEEIEHATGIPAAALFWAATDDADAAEASSTVIALPGSAERLTAAVVAPAGTPMHDAPLGDVAPLLARLSAAAGAGAYGAALEITRTAYASTATVGGAFVDLLAALLNPLGIAVLDAGDVRVRAAAAPVTLAAVERAPEVARALATRGAELRAAGFTPQVSEIDDLALVFERRDGVKSRLPATTTRRPPAEALSPNVLLRPIVERAILPTVAYMAGPGELAYFAQVSAVATALGAEQPLALPRWSCTILEPRVARVLERLGLERTELADSAAPERRIAERALPEAARSVIEQARQQAMALGTALTSLAEGDAIIDRRVAEGHAHRAEWLAARIERRILAAVKRRETDAMFALGTARGSLYPFGVRQERALNFIPLLARYGPAMLDDMSAAAAAHAGRLIGG